MRIEASERKWGTLSSVISPLLLAGALIALHGGAARAYGQASETLLTNSLSRLYSMDPEDNLPFAISGATKAPDRFGRADRSLQLDATWEMVWTDDPNALPMPNNGFTLAAWICPKWGFDGGWRTIFGNYGVTPFSAADRAVTVEFRLAPQGPNTMRLELNTGYILQTAPLSWTSNVWYHVAVVRDGDAVTFYRNGQAISSTKWQAYPGSLRYYAGSSIGCRRFPWMNSGMDVPENVFLGLIDDIRIYTRGFTWNEVDRLFRYESTPQVQKRRARSLVFVGDTGSITSIMMLDPGAGYTSVPKIHLQGTGQGAVLTPVVVNGQITSVTVENGGTDYEPGAVLTLAAPAAPAVASVAPDGNGHIILNLQLTLGVRYQVETASDLAHWTPVGDPFVADPEFQQRIFAFSPAGAFFRAVEVQ